MSSTPRRKPNHFKKYPRRIKEYTLEPNQRGFLCSCNFREKECIREAYNILNEHADLLFAASSTAEQTDKQSESAEIEDELDKEIADMKSQRKEAKRFQVVESGAKNFLFIRTTVDDPVKLAHHVVKSVYEDNRHQTRQLLRLIPIEVTCRAYIGDVEQSIQPLIDKYFMDVPKTYSIVFSHRNNSSLSKDDVIKMIADKVAAARSDHKVNLKEGDWTILVEVIRGIALLAVIPDFLKYKKFNLHLGVAGSSETGKSEESFADMKT